MPRRFRAGWRDGLGGPVAALILALAVPLAPAVGEGPSLSAPPVPRPDPLAEWRAERRDWAKALRAFERERREDWLDWQRDRGGSYNQWRRERREAERALGERRRKDWLARQRPRPDDSVRALGERLDEQWRRQRELGDDRLSGPRRPDPFRPDRPRP